MAEMLKHNITLRELNMSDNLIGDEGAVAMAEMLQHNTTLRKLNMSGNTIGEWGTQVMTVMLKNHATLTELDTGEQTIAYNTVLETLKYSIKVREPGMKINFDRDERAKAVIVALRHNTTLEVLDMSCSSVGHREAVAMAGMLKHNTTRESST